MRSAYLRSHSLRSGRAALFANGGPSRAAGRAAGRALLAFAIALTALLAAPSSGIASHSTEPGQLSGAIPPPDSFGLLNWGGGTLTELRAAADAASCNPRSVWANASQGGFVGHIFGAPSFVNREFAKNYPLEILPEAPIILVCGPDQRSPFSDSTVISFYGHPDTLSLGILGNGGPEAVADQIDALAADYDAANGALGVTSAFHIIVGVASNVPTGDGTFLNRISDETLSEWIEVARERGMLVFLDIQIGWSDALTEVRRRRDFLAEPFVHVALDPEFATKADGVPPGEVIGSLDAASVNAVQAELASIVREFNLPPKVLVLHQFSAGMLSGTDSYDDVAEVELLIDMDGFGDAALKLTHYGLFALADYAERPGIKIFFDFDTDPQLGPETLFELEQPPDLIIYQ